MTKKIACIYRLLNCTYYVYSVRGENKQILRVPTRHPAVKTSLTMAGCHVEISRIIDFSCVVFFCGTEYSLTVVVQDTT